jgi:hypothetical protein
MTAPASPSRGAGDGRSGMSRTWVSAIGAVLVGYAILALSEHLGILRPPAIAYGALLILVGAVLIYGEVRS